MRKEGGNAQGKLNLQAIFGPKTGFVLIKEGNERG